MLLSFSSFLLFAGFSCLVAWVVSVRRRKFNVFSSMGVSGPEPNFLFGNLHEFAKKRSYEAYSGWTEKFGKTYGMYEGSTPVLITTDTDIIRDVFIKKFNSFNGRRLFPVQPEPDTGADKDVHILFSRGPRWRRLRATISPSFSTCKMKLMLPLINACIDPLMLALDAKCKAGEEFDIHGLMQGMTMNVISMCAFGLSPVYQRDENDPILLRCRRLFEDFARKPWILVLGVLFPECRNVWWKVCKTIASFTYDDMEWLFANLGHVIEARRRESAAGVPPARVDLLQLLLDAEVGGGTPAGGSLTQLTMTDRDDNATGANGANSCMGGNNNNNGGCGFAHCDQEATRDKSAEDVGTRPGDLTASQDKRGGGQHVACPGIAAVRSPSAGVQAGAAGCPGQSKAKLSMDEVIATSVVFLIGGYETTSNLISYVTYEMAKHPECQIRLQRELDDILSSQNEFTYENITRLPYLDMIIKEALRMYPMGMLLTGRMCMHEDVVGNGLLIPKGMMVQPNVWSLHRDPSHWGDFPDDFDPERFSPEKVAQRDPMAYLPFGAGPKNCVGMRFALTECKFAVARLMSKYTLAATPRTNLELVDGAALNPKNGVIIKLVDRCKKVSGVGQGQAA